MTSITTESLFLISSRLSWQLAYKEIDFRGQDFAPNKSVERRPGIGGWMLLPRERLKKTTHAIFINWSVYLRGITEWIFGIESGNVEKNILFYPLPKERLSLDPMAHFY